MRMKKPACLAAAALLALLTVPASAAARPAGIEGGSTKFTAESFLPDVEIQVSVPAESKLYINPLSLPVEIDGTVENKQIVCETSHLENQSVVPVIVDVTVSGAVKEGSDMTLYSVSTQGSASTAKRAFFYFEMQAVDDPAHVEWSGGYDSTEHIPVRIYARTKREIVTLDAAGGAACYGAFHLDGDCIPTPKNAWTEADGVDVTVVFTFRPIRET